MFYDALPYYLSVGMSSVEFWEADCRLAKSFREANNLNKQKRSEEMWLQGLYNFNAFSTALSNLHFGKGHKKLNKYMEEPLRITPLTKAEKAQKAEEERQKVIAFFNNLAKEAGV